MSYNAMKGDALWKQFCTIMTLQCWTSFFLLFFTVTAIINFSYLSLFVSISAALQVSISLNKVELSVGESKFFICTGTHATHTFTHTICFFETGQRGNKEAWFQWGPFVVYITASRTWCMMSIWRMTLWPSGGWIPLVSPPQCPFWTVYKHFIAKTWCQWLSRVAIHFGRHSPPPAGGLFSPAILLSVELTAKGVMAQWEERWGVEVCWE